ncbi:molecular chaperone TorD family protein [Paenibacillus sp. KQZ6P-2]|uniref:Molecular chaperone TorD family protein n=1 Tax=Paenibacillus mangrovi TaxID=2931978 RepID=A0A9X2B6K2_9BACL|nr:molecular chaperone TorD family protein [Paenibacillus mangrovi]MCJ8012828.1 molecular chaperone TorD family protein [Paenibacillus mangrovi]
MTTTASERLLDTTEGTRWLQGRGWVYQLLIDFSGNSPSLSLMAPWQRQAALREELALTEGGRRLQEYLGELEPCELSKVCQTETLEYERLFAGPDALLPCICESIYCAADQRSGQRCLQNIREAYAGCGIVFNKLQSETDDHLAIELEFIAVAGEHMDDAQGLPESRLMWLDTQIDFLENHLMKWTPRLSNELIALARTPLYREIGHIVGEFIPYDLQMLRLLRKDLT